MKHLCWLFILVASAAIGAEPTYPTRPVRILNPFPPGGGSDIMARVLGQKLTELWGQTVVVDDRPGAGGNIGTVIVSKSQPDGHTILIHSSAFAVNPTLYKNAGYDALKDFVPIILGGISPNIVCVHPSVAANSLQELISLAKQKPLSFATPGTGTTPHLTGMLLFMTLAGVNMTHVPYGGAALAVNSVVGAQNPVSVTSLPPTVQMVKSGRLRAIAVSSPQRVPVLPETATVAEQGFPGYADYTWIGFLAPAGTPREIVAKVNADIARVLQMPDVRGRLAPIGFDPMPNSPREFSDYLKSEVVKWAKVIKTSGARVD